MAALALTDAFRSAFAFVSPSYQVLADSDKGAKEAASDVAKSNGDFVLTPQREFV